MTNPIKASWKDLLFIKKMLKPHYQGLDECPISATAALNCL